MIDSGFTFLSLDERPDLFAIVNDRIWRAWWESKGKTFEDVQAGLKQVLDEGPLYSGFVALDGNTYAGSALVNK